MKCRIEMIASCSSYCQFCQASRKQRSFLLSHLQATLPTRPIVFSSEACPSSQMLKWPTWLDGPKSDTKKCFQNFVGEKKRSETDTKQLVDQRGKWYILMMSMLPFPWIARIPLDCQDSPGLPRSLASPHFSTCWPHGNLVVSNNVLVILG